MITLNVNGKPRSLDIPAEMPLLWTLRDVLNMTGTKFGCGMGLCGACTIHIDGQPTRSCVTPVSAAAGKRITTIEAIGATPAGKKVQRAVARTRRAAMRILPIRPDYVGERAAGE
jgi:isoquinoline 1-oxidoreductase alpha subunit